MELVGAEVPESCVVEAYLSPRAHKMGSETRQLLRDVVQLRADTFMLGHGARCSKPFTDLIRPND